MKKLESLVRRVGSIALTLAGLACSDGPTPTEPDQARGAPPGPARSTPIAFVRSGADGLAPRLYLAATHGGTVRYLTVGDAPAWSPDGGFLAFERGDRVFVIGAEGDGERSIGVGRHPSWSPDGTRIVVTTPAGIEVMNADGTQRVLLHAHFLDEPFHEVYALAPTWSPAGHSIAFLQALGHPPLRGSSSLLLMSPNGADLRTIPVPGWPRSARWSPDGARIAMELESQQERHLVSVAADGSDLRIHAVRIGGSSRGLDWSPDGRFLVFSRLSRLWRLRLSDGAMWKLLAEDAAGDPYEESGVAWARSAGGAR